MSIFIYSFMYVCIYLSIYLYIYIYIYIFTHVLLGERHLHCVEHVLDQRDDAPLQHLVWGLGSRVWGLGF